MDTVELVELKLKLTATELIKISELYSQLLADRRKPVIPLDNNTTPTTKPKKAKKEKAKAVKVTEPEEKVVEKVAKVVEEKVVEPVEEKVEKVEKVVEPVEEKVEKVEKVEVSEPVPVPEPEVVADETVYDNDEFSQLPDEEDALIFKDLGEFKDDDSLESLEETKVTGDDSLVEEKVKIQELDELNELEKSLEENELNELEESVDEKETESPLLEVPIVEEGGGEKSVGDAGGEKDDSVVKEIKKRQRLSQQGMQMFLKFKTEQVLLGHRRDKAELERVEFIKDLLLQEKYDEVDLLIQTEISKRDSGTIGVVEPLAAKSN